MDKDLPFLACSNKEFYTLGPSKTDAFFKYSVFGRGRKRVEFDPRKLWP